MPSVALTTYNFLLRRPALSGLARTFVSALLLSVLSYGQCPTANGTGGVGIIPSLPRHNPAALEPVLPEAGFLSDTHYTSQFFGFSFDLPMTVRGHEVMLPVMPEKEHALLALQYEGGGHKSSFAITAYDPVKGFDSLTPEYRQEQQQQILRNGVILSLPPQPLPPENLLHPQQFQHRTTHKGRVYEAEYRATIDNYVVKILAHSDDAEFFRRVKQNMAETQFFCPLGDGNLATRDGKLVKASGSPYFGPTAPTFRVNAAIRDTPGSKIPSGEPGDTVYRNRDLGLEYEYPQGWQPVAISAADPPEDGIPLREYRFLHACSKDLVRIAPAPVPPTVTSAAILVRALDLECLSMRAAASLDDKRAVDEIAAALERLGEFGQVATDGLIAISGRLFMVFRGTVAASPDKEHLVARLSQTIVATRHNKLLLVWCIAAHDEPALDHMAVGSVAFGDSPPIQLSQANRALSPHPE